MAAGCFTVGRLVVALIAVWLLAILLMSGPLLHGNSADQQDQAVLISRRLDAANAQLQQLRQQNRDMRQILADIRIGNSENGKPTILKQSLEQQLLQPVIPDTYSVVHSDSCEPKLDFELARRRVQNGIAEMSYFIDSEFRKLKQNAQGDILQQLQNIHSVVEDQRRVLQHDFNNMSQLNGFQEWRATEAHKLANLVQARFRYIQNPKDCAERKKLVCNLNKGCGYGCQVHHLVYCFIMAYGTNRTLILTSEGWRYEKKGWDTVFRPISDTCTASIGGGHMWSGMHALDAEVINLPIIDNMSHKPPFLPLSIPADIGHRLVKLHSNPPAWWIGQILSYLLRPQDDLQKIIDDYINKLNFQTPAVGIHVRRTDKLGSEASFHSLQEYMTHVEDYYKLKELEKPDIQRRVYLATDDPSVLSDAKKLYPHYVFYGDTDISKTASSVSSRYSKASLIGVILDVHLLSLTDYLVCTFSSQVCRLAYEMMQTLHPDAGSWFHSLDDIYYMGGQNAHNQRARFKHDGTGEQISFIKGDILGIAGNHWDGYSKGSNRRTGAIGLYPSYKAIDVIELAEMPTYPEVKAP